MEISNISDAIKEKNKNPKAVETNTKNKNIQSDPKNRGTGVAFMYMIVTIIVYFLISKILGNKDSILQVFVTNAWEDMSGGTAGIVVQKTLADFKNNRGSDFIRAIYDNFMLSLPLVFCFSCIDGFVGKHIKGNNRIIFAFTFIAGYILQAIIGLSCSEPVSLNSLDSIVLWMIIGEIITCIAFYMIPRKRRGISIKADEMYVDIKGIVKYMIYFYLTELLKAAFVMMLFSLIAEFILVIASVLKFNLLVRLLSVISPFVFLLFYKGVGEAGDIIGTLYAEFFLRFLGIDKNSIKKNNSFCELYCMASSVLILILCVVYHLIKL